MRRGCALDDDPLGPGQQRHAGHVLRRQGTVRFLLVLLAVSVAFVSWTMLSEASAGDAISGTGSSAGPLWHQYLPFPVLAVVAFLLAMSAFFSSCETAFLSIRRPRLRAMREESKLSARLVVEMLDNPGRLLTTILVGNLLVNTLIGVVLGTRVENALHQAVQLPAAASYAAAIVVTTGVLLFFGEITPKVFAVRFSERYARVAVYPLIAVSRILAPVRDGMLRVTDFIFRITRFHELRAAPFITDEELRTLLSNSDEQGDIEEEGRQMIRRILEYHDAQLREIVTPRPDIVAVAEDATVEEALELYRAHEYSRIPIYREDLDHITGVLFAKDLLPCLSEGELESPVKTVARPPHFVPETMSVQGFIREAQRLRAHLAIVVDEFGGTEGIVTLHDAIEQVVGAIGDEDEEEERLFEKLGEQRYRVDGSLPLDELSELVGVSLEDEEHQTVAGFLMNKSDKVPQVGDQITVSGVSFTVERMEGKRAATLLVEVQADSKEAES